MRLRGSVDVGALERSLGEIVRRHESLRTRFEVVDGEPVQVISSGMEMRLGIVDLSRKEEKEREGAMMEACREEALAPFDLSEGPLLRASVTQVVTRNQYNRGALVPLGWYLSPLAQFAMSKENAECPKTVAGTSPALK